MDRRAIAPAGVRSARRRPPSVALATVEAFDAAGLPSPKRSSGFAHNGLPVGLQIVGPMHRDALVLRAARAFETARPFADRRPAL